MNASGLVVLIAQVGPTEFFVPDGGVIDVDGGGGGWLMWGVGVVVIVLVGVWLRAMGQRRVDPRELAFVALCRRLELSRKQVAGIRAMSESGGVSPVGVLMSPGVVSGGGLEG